MRSWMSSWQFAFPWVCLVCLVVFAFPAPSAPARDLNGDGVVDGLDLFEASQSWTEGVDANTLLETYADWHTGARVTPTPTPTPTVPPSPIPTNTPAASPTPTATPVSTSTPTATPTPTSVAAPTATPTAPAGEPSVTIDLCDTQSLVDELVSFGVHLLDSQGRIANPGMPGGLPPRTVTVTVSGTGSFFGSESIQIPITDPRGARLDVQGIAPGVATLIAQATDLAGAPPVQIEFLEGGTISGSAQVFDENLNGFRPATFNDLTIQFIPAAEGGRTTATSPRFDNPGLYQSQPLAPGFYDVAIRPLTAGTFERVCITGIEVTAGADRSNVDFSVGLAPAGTRVFGNVSATDSTGLTFISVVLAPAEPDCTRQEFVVQEFSFTPMPGMAYEFPNVPPGNYTVFAEANGQAGFLTSGPPVPLAITGAEQEIDLTVQPVIQVVQVSPVNYQRVSGSFSLQWQEPSMGSNWVYDVIVTNLCDQEVWVQTGITGESVLYDGPPLDPAQAYRWSVSGEAEGFSALSGNPQTQPFFVGE